MMLAAFSLLLQSVFYHCLFITGWQLVKQLRGTLNDDTQQPRTHFANSGHTNANLRDRTRPGSK